MVENELLFYIGGGITLASGVAFIVSAYNFNKGLNQLREEERRKYEKQQKAKANDLESVLVSIPEEQRQKTINSINIITQNSGLHQSYFEPILKKYSQS